MAKASFSVCEYYRSTGLSDLLAYATICKSSCSGLHCDKVADNTHCDASVVNSVLLFPSKLANTISLVRRYFILFQAFVCCSSHQNGMSFCEDSQWFGDTAEV